MTASYGCSLAATIFWCHSNPRRAGGFDTVDFALADRGPPWFSFGRLRRCTNAAIFAFAGNAIFAAIYYSTQRLCKARMWSDLLSQLHFWGWQLIISRGRDATAGFTQGKEYAELEWPIDIAIAVVWLLIFGTNFLMTLVHRRERHMYAAVVLHRHHRDRGHPARFQ